MQVCGLPMLFRTALYNGNRTLKTTSLHILISREIPYNESREGGSWTKISSHVQPNDWIHFPFVMENIFMNTAQEVGIRFITQPFLP